MRLKSYVSKYLASYLPPVAGSRAKWTDRLISRLGFGVAGLGAFALSLILGNDSNLKPSVAIKQENFKVLKSGTAECAREMPARKDCPASAENETLWASDLDPDSEGFKHFLMNSNGDQFWIGLKVEAAELRQAAQRRSANFLLAPIDGDVEVWIDGVFYMEHSFSRQKLPLSLSLPRSRLFEARPLLLAIRVLPYPSHRARSPIDAGFEQGFYSSINADRFMRWTVFSGLTRHLITFVLFLLLGRILWTSSAGNQSAYDYITGAQFAFLMAVISLNSMDIAARLLPVAAQFRVTFLLLFLEAVFVFRLAVSFLRATRSWSVFSLCTLAISAIVVYALPNWLWIESSGIRLMTLVALPGIYGICALALGIRAVQMLLARVESSRARIGFLLSACFSMAATAFSYALESGFKSGSDVTWSRIVNVVTVYLVVRLVTRVARAQSASVSRLPSASESRHSASAHKAA